MEDLKLEIACFNLESALIAEQGGADRIELCDDFSSGGITPDHDTIKLAREKLKIDLFIMIRPRAGNFVYSEKEFARMKIDILFCKEIGVDGFVFGILNSENMVDEKRNKELIELAKPLPCSFHRAFDYAVEPFVALESIIKCGFKTILTSGQAPNAVEGIFFLVKLLEMVTDRIIIMPGGGVRSSNIGLLKEKINTNYFHSSAILNNSIADLEEVKFLKQKLT